MPSKRNHSISKWRPENIADFDAETGHLTNEAVGLFQRFKHAMWVSQTHLPSDPHKLAMIGRTTAARVRKLFPDMEPFLEPVVDDNGALCGWQHAGLMAALETAKGKAENYRRGAEKGHQARRLNVIDGGKRGSNPNGIPAKPNRVSNGTEGRTSSSCKGDRGRGEGDYPDNPQNPGSGKPQGGRS